MTNKQQNPTHRETSRFEQLVDRAELECSLQQASYARKFMAIAWLVHNSIEQRGEAVNTDNFLALTLKLQRAEKKVADRVRSDAREAA